MSVQIFQMFTNQWGDFDLLLEDGGLFRVSTLNPANQAIGAITLGNFDLAVLGGSVLSIITDLANVPPGTTNQLFAYAGGTYNVCKMGGGTETIVPNGGT